MYADLKNYQNKSQYSCYEQAGTIRRPSHRHRGMDYGHRRPCRGIVANNPIPAMIDEHIAAWVIVGTILVLGYLLVNNLDLRWRLAKANARIRNLESKLWTSDVDAILDEILGDPHERR